MRTQTDSVMRVYQCIAKVFVNISKTNNVPRDKNYEKEQLNGAKHGNSQVR